MLSYLEKYNSLPALLRDALSTNEVMSAISDIEKEYNVSLATIIMRVMVKEIQIIDLAKLFVFEYNLDGHRADELVSKLKSMVFNNVAEHLGIAVSKKSPAPEETKTEAWETDKVSDAKVEGSNFFFSTEDEEEVKELTQKVAGFKEEVKKNKEQDEKVIQEKVNRTVYEMKLNFSSEDLHNRYWQILYTYKKGVRNKMDTKQTLMKDVATGGVGLNESLTDKSLSTADRIGEEVDKEVKNKPKDDLSTVLKKELPSVLEKETLPIKETKKETGVKEIKDILSNKQSKEGESNSSSIGKAETKPNQDAASIAQNGARDMDYDFSALKKSPKASPSENTGADETEVGKEDQGPQKTINLEEIDKEKKDEKNTSAPALDLHTINLRANEKKETPPKHESQQKTASPEGVLDLSRDQGEVKMPSPREKSEKIKPTIVSNPPVAKKPKIVNWHAPKKGQERAENGKVKMQDVKSAPKLVGPVEEIGEMDLLNFRRLSQDPKEAADKIKEKINFLEEDSYLKRSNAISAWRKSPVYTLYLALGQASIKGRKNVTDIIKERQEKNEEVLTNKEFDAIMNLNKSLRF